MAVRIISRNFRLSVRMKNSRHPMRASLSVVVGILLAIPVAWVLLHAGLRTFIGRRQNMCFANLRLIETAKNDWIWAKAEEQAGRKLQMDEVKVYARELAEIDVTKAMLLEFLRDGVLPKCPSGGQYLYRTMKERPICTAHGDLLAVQGGSKALFAEQ